MENILQGLPRVICYLDDILVTGENGREHLELLEELFQRLETSGLRLKRAKCSFMQSEVHYLGYRINADGLHTTEEKVKAIRDAPQPQNQQQLV